MNFVIRDLHGPDISAGLLDTLSNLAEARLTPEEAGELHRRRLRTGVRCYVAWSTVSKAVIGTASLLVEQKFIHQGGMVGHIEDVSVRLGYEKRGIGTALVRHATEQARKIGCYKVILNCAEHLIPFYESLGFRWHAVQLRTNLCGSSIAERSLDRISNVECQSQYPRTEVSDSNSVPAAAPKDVLPLANIG